MLSLLRILATSAVVSHSVKWISRSYRTLVIYCGNHVDSKNYGIFRVYTVQNKHNRQHIPTCIVQASCAWIHPHTNSSLQDMPEFGGQLRSASSRCFRSSLVGRCTSTCGFGWKLWQLRKCWFRFPSSRLAPIVDGVCPCVGFNEFIYLNVDSEYAFCYAANCYSRTYARKNPHRLHVTELQIVTDPNAHKTRTHEFQGIFKSAFQQ